MWPESISFLNFIYCDVPGSPCLSKKDESNVRFVPFKIFCLGGYLACLLLGLLSLPERFVGDPVWLARDNIIKVLSPYRSVLSLWVKILFLVSCTHPPFFCYADKEEMERRICRFWTIHNNYGLWTCYIDIIRVLSPCRSVLSLMGQNIVSCFMHAPILLLPWRQLRTLWTTYQWTWVTYLLPVNSHQG